MGRSAAQIAEGCDGRAKKGSEGSDSERSREGAKQKKNWLIVREKGNERRKLGIVAELGEERWVWRSRCRALASVNCGGRHRQATVLGWAQGLRQVLALA